VVTIYKDTMHFCRSYDECQKAGNLIFSIVAKLVMALSSDSFMKWELDFIGLIKLVGRYTWNKYVMVVTNYTQMGGSKGVTIQHGSGYGQIFI